MTDAQIAAVLMAPPGESVRSIAERLGLSFYKVRPVRERTSRRALRIANHLGLPTRATRICFTGVGNVLEHNTGDLVTRLAP